MLHVAVAGSAFATLAAASFGADWTPINTALVVGALLYVVTNCAVMIIRAVKGDPRQTTLETMVGQIFQTVQQHGDQLNTIAKDFVPPESVNELIKSQVTGILQQYARRQPPPAGGTTTTAAVVKTTTAAQPPPAGGA